MPGYMTGGGGYGPYVMGTGSYSGTPGQMLAGDFNPLDRTQNKSLQSAGIQQQQIDARRRAFMNANMPRPSYGQPGNQRYAPGAGGNNQPGNGGLDFNNLVDSIMGQPTNSTNNQIYQQSQMARAGEMAASEALTAANIPWLANQAARPGMSVRSPGLLQRVMPQFAQAMNQGREAQFNTPYQMDVQNAGFRTQNQVAGEDEMQGYGRLDQMIRSANRGAGIDRLSSIFNLVGGIMGG